MEGKSYDWASDEERQSAIKVLIGLDVDRPLSATPTSDNEMRIYRWEDLDASDREGWVPQRVVHKLRDLGFVTGWGTHRKYWQITPAGRKFLRNPR